MSFALAWGFNRAVGTTVPLSPYGSGGMAVVGTAPAPGSVIISDTNGGGTITLQEDSDSPTIERGIQCTCQHKFTLDYDEGLSLLSVIGMGTVVQDSFGNIWRVLTCSLQSESGTRGKLITVSESVSFDLPPDEFQINSVDLGIDIIKHPRYFPNLYPKPGEFGTIVGQVKEAIIRGIQAYRDSPFFPSTSQVSQFITGQVQANMQSTLANGMQAITLPNINFNPLLPVRMQYDVDPDNFIQDSSSYTYPPIATVPTFESNDQSIYVSVDNVTLDDPSIALAYAAAQEIITKLWRMEDSPYFPGVEVKYSFYSFLPPYFNLGSYLEDPDYIVPNYFMQPDRPLTELPPRGGFGYPVAGTDNVFQLNASANPQDFSSDGTVYGNTEISWLRKSDEQVWERGLCKTTLTWVGSGLGFFDPQLYGAFNRPTVPSDYQTFA